jgi:hypothetical protein
VTPTPELERMARAIDPEAFMPWAFEAQDNLTDEDRAEEGYRMLVAAKAAARNKALNQARAALQSLLPVSDEAVEAMGRAWVNNDPFVAPQPSHVLGLTNALAAAIHHITGEGQ